MENSGFNLGEKTGMRDLDYMYYKIEEFANNNNKMHSTSFICTEELKIKIKACFSFSKT